MNTDPALPDGTFFHSSITATPPRRCECAAGWVAHYTIGVVLALIFLALAPGDWLARPTFLNALLDGIGTVVFPLYARVIRRATESYLLELLERNSPVGMSVSANGSGTAANGDHLNWELPGTVYLLEFTGIPTC